ncbi:MAG: alpha/beta hydrolase [Micrococcales bacterium]|nr:alpha/beta hydrolase [Micrococcales bacterium]
MSCHRYVIAAALTAALVAAGSPALAGSPAPVDYAAGVVAADNAPAAAAPSTQVASAIAWKKCGAGMQCSSIEVPLDWGAPEGPKIKIAVARILADKKPAKLGSLLINPGGPGVSGISFLPYMPYIISDDVLEQYDIVGFDPRGVGASTSVRCVSSTAEMDKLVGSHFPTTKKGRAKSIKNANRIGERCNALTGPLLAHIDTASAARDMDAIRAALGEEKLNYLGFSYGTKLGAYYTELFPDRVGRFVLDGAMDPSKSGEATSNAQLKGFDMSLRAFAKDCAKRRCALGSTRAKVLTTIGKLLKRIEKKPMKTKVANNLNITWATTGIVEALYDEYTWPELEYALVQAAKKGNAVPLLKLAYSYHERERGKYQSNSSIANLAINCLDYGGVDSSLASIRRAKVAAKKISPTFGRYWIGDGVDQCAHWPYPQVGQPHAISTTTTAPIIIIGTTGDPATPYAQAKALSRQMKTSRLLTYVGEGHTAYGRANWCIQGAVDRYLTKGTLPPAGKRC